MPGSLKNITINDIATILAFIAGVISSITVIWKVYASRKQKRREADHQVIQKIVAEAVNQAVKPLQEQLAINEAKINALQLELSQNNLKTSRLDLSEAIETTPHEHQAIMALATDYFLKQHGDTWMSGKFRKWAQDEGVDISYITDQVPHLKAIESAGKL